MKAQIGIIGLAVMGENLAMNMESKGFRVAVYNRTREKTDNFIQGRAAGKRIIGASTIDDLINSLEKPRTIMLMIKAGAPVDDTLATLAEKLDRGDIIIDGGNSYYEDTERRVKFAESKGLYYIGTGVSGGEEGALLGPSLMPGGSKEAWRTVEPIFKAISAKANDGAPCCEWMGEGGAGHYVKMVHNGIEYGDMELICEAYSVMKNLLKMTNAQAGDTFSKWNKGALDSYLIQITADILSHKESDGSYTVDCILDVAGQKGTGKWTSVAALDEGVPLTLINEAVYARFLSAIKTEREKAAAKLKKDTPSPFTEDRELFVADLEKALYAAKIISYAQGFSLLRQASARKNWKLRFGDIAMIWRGGCIIRSEFLNRIREAFDKNPSLENLLLDDYFARIATEARASLRRVTSLAILNGISVPAFCAAACYLDGYSSETLPANLLQAQRDYFGAHTYERTDKKRGEFFHTDWTGRGGKTKSETYNA